MTAMIYNAEYVVRMIEIYLGDEPTDHMVGLRVRVLFELRAEELEGLGVIGLPDPPDDDSPHD